MKKKNYLGLPIYTKGQQAAEFKQRAKYNTYVNALKDQGSFEFNSPASIDPDIMSTARQRKRFPKLTTEQTEED